MAAVNLKVGKRVARNMWSLKAVWNPPAEPSRECTVYHNVYTEDEIEAWVMGIAKALEAAYCVDVKISFNTADAAKPDLHSHPT